MKQFITILALLFTFQLGMSQVNWFDNTPAWFPLEFKEADSIGVVQAEGQVGNFELIIASTQVFNGDTVPAYQFCKGYVDASQGKITNFSITRYRKGSYFYLKLKGQRDAIISQQAKNELFIDQYEVLVNPLTTPFDTTDLIPIDTTGGN